MNRQRSPRPTTPAQSDTERERNAQREQLNDSERDAKRNQPENYQEEAVQQKVVSTERERQDEAGAIQGLDNKPEESQRPR